MQTERKGQTQAFIRLSPHHLHHTVVKRSDEEFCKEVIPGRQNQSKAGELSPCCTAHGQVAVSTKAHASHKVLNERQHTRVSLSNTMPQKRNLTEGTALLHLNARQGQRGQRSSANEAGLSQVGWGCSHDFTLFVLCIQILLTRFMPKGRKQK